MISSALAHVQPESVAVSHICPSCHGSTSRVVLDRLSPVKKFNQAHRFSLRQCTECNNGWIPDPPLADEIAPLYDNDFFLSSQQALPVDARGNLLEAGKHHPVVINAQRRVDEVAKYRKEGRLLEIGCANGMFLHLARHRFSVVGVDIAQPAIEFCRTKFGLEAHLGDIRQMELGAAAFDVVAMWDSVASIPELDPLFERVADLLKPGGILAFTVPDIESLAFRLLKRRWPLLIPPINLHYLSKQGTERLLARHGMRLLTFRHEGKWISTNFILRKLGRTFGIAALDKPTISIPFMPRIYLNLGDIATIYAVKA